MNDRVELEVTMELLSDTIIGSGFSIPGGEDIAVCKDDDGWPYLKGSTLKGLLRESVENWIEWTNGDKSLLPAIFGEPGWNGQDEDRGLHPSRLLLSEKPRWVEDCYDSRTFTAIEDGIADDKTLRSASCVTAGLSFKGTLSCHKNDSELLQNAISAIKWVGTMRNRGFGSVRFTSEETSASRGDVDESVRNKNGISVSGTQCIKYRIHTNSPVIVTDLGRSSGNSYETIGYISGTAVRGMVIGRLASGSNKWFSEHRVELLSDKVRFLDAYPVIGNEVPIPSPRCFYEGKNEDGRIENVVENGELTPGYKRAKLGAFCAIKEGNHGDIIYYWSAETNGNMRINRGKKEMFQTRYLCEGQDFEGYIIIENPSLSAKIIECFNETIWLGADRFSGFGECSGSANSIDNGDGPEWIRKYGVSADDNLTEELYMIAVSPFSMLDDIGENCGLNLKELAEKMGVEKVDACFCSTSVTEHGEYNRTWCSRNPGTPMYDRGSVFKLKFSSVPEIEKIQEIQASGIGIRRAEGFGQILFMSKEKFEKIDQKEKADHKKTASVDNAAELRRSRYQWIMEKAPDIVDVKASKSQIGSIQALCEKAVANGGAWTELKSFLEKNLKDRGAEHGERFREINDLITSVMNRPLNETLGNTKLECDESNESKLRLLIMLFDFSRKEL